MRQKLSLFLLGIALFSGAASLNAQVKTDYDHSANFSSYKTYSWLKFNREIHSGMTESSRTSIPSLQQRAGPRSTRTGMHR